VSRTPFRILVFDLPPLLRDLVRRALDSSDDIASTTATADALEEAVAAAKPDAVIVPLEDASLSGESRRFLEERARVRVLGLGLRDGRAVLYELRPERSELGEVSPDEFAQAVRAAVSREVRV
jgi:DNA-binding NarL/FixJ family response regulator